MCPAVADTSHAVLVLRQTSCQQVCNVCVKVGLLGCCSKCRQTQLPTLQVPRRKLQAPRPATHRSMVTPLFCVVACWACQYGPSHMAGLRLLDTWARSQFIFCLHANLPPFSSLAALLPVVLAGAVWREGNVCIMVFAASSYCMRAEVSIGTCRDLRYALVCGPRGLSARGPSQCSAYQAPVWFALFYGMICPVLEASCAPAALHICLI